MPGPTLTLDYSNALINAIGDAHGLASAEIKRAAADLSGILKDIEKERAAGQHRYRDLPADRRMLTEIQKAAKARRPGLENLVVLGIGGSALGNIALQTALNPAYYNLLPAAKRKGPRLFVMDNVDPTQFAALLDALGSSLNKTLFNVISKSGETAETAAQFAIVRSLLTKKLGAKAAQARILATTDPEGGTLREFATREGYDTLSVPPGVGGRFSVLSAVGLFSAAVCGIDVAKLLAGAGEMSRRVATPSADKNPAAMLALLLYQFYARGKRLHVMMPYSHQLKEMADWYCQLWAESLAKVQDLQGRPTIVGPTPIRALGATDQHSQVQLYREGPNDKVFIFLEVEKFGAEVKIPAQRDLPESMHYLNGASLGKLLNAEKRATEYALVASRRPCLTIKFPAVTPHAVGQFILLWEAATTIMGRLLNINPYDQPAVQLGKDFTYGLMGKKGYESQAKAFEKWAAKGGKAVV